MQEKQNLKTTYEIIKEMPEEQSKLYFDGLMDDPKFNGIGQHSVLLNIIDRLEIIERRVFKSERKNRATRVQQILLLHHLGMLKPLLELDINQEMKAKILSIIVDASMDNIYNDLGQLKKERPDINTKNNIDFIYKVFEDAGLLEDENFYPKFGELDNLLLRIRDEKKV